MSVSVNASEKTSGKETNNLVRRLNPKTFVKMFTLEKCTFEEKLIQEILKCICALRNSGGGKLTISLTGTCTSSEVEKCVDIIKNAVDEVLPDTGKADLLEWTFSNRIVFLVQGSKEIVTMKYNMYVMTDGEAKLVASAAEARLILSGKREQETTKHDMNVVTIQCTKSDEKLRLDFHEKTRKEQLKYGPIVQESSPSDKMPRSGFHGGTAPTVYFKNYNTMEHAPVSPKLSPIKQFVEGKRVEIPTEYNSEQTICFEELENTSSTEKSVANRILLREDILRARVYDFAKYVGGHVYYGISSDGIVCGVNISKSAKRKVRKIVKKKIMSIKFHEKRDTWHVDVYLKRIEDKTGRYISNLFVIGIYVPPFPKAARYDHRWSSEYFSESTPVSPSESVSVIQSPYRKIEEMDLDQGHLIKDQKVKVPTTKLSKETVKFKLLEDDKLSSTQKSVAHRITLEKNKLLPYVSAFANHRQGGELYYGISSDGTVCGEMMLETEIEEIRGKVDKEIASMVWPQPGDIHKVMDITFLHVEDEDEIYRSRCVIKISVSPCSGGVFVEGPVSYHVVENRVKKIPFSKWIARMQDSTMIASDRTARIDFEEREIFERIFLPTDYQIFLKGLEWVESFKIVDANEECNECHLEIVCKLGKVPRTADLVNYFGKEILPFITYQECSKREWFETNLFDEDSDMNEKYEDELASYPWVKNFYIGVASKPEKSWQIYITCAENKVPSMADLKELFGVNIASFVDFIQESVDEDSEDNEKSISSSGYLRGPISGDELCVQDDRDGYGAIGVLTAANEKHYATTCYHVCYKEDLPKTDLQKGHEILKKDWANENSKGCQGATCLYTTEGERNLLGRFCHGLYDDNHDIALVELESSLNCSDMVKFLEEKGIRPVLANKQEVRGMLYDKKALPVEKVSLVPRKGMLVGVRDVRRCPRNKRCYRIKGIKGRRAFASEGDSGSLVYLVYEEENIPFAYVCMIFPESDGNVYYCRNLNESTNELIKRSKRDDLKDVKPCFTDHKSENETS